MPSVRCASCGSLFSTADSVQTARCPGCGADVHVGGDDTRVDDRQGAQPESRADETRSAIGPPAPTSAGSGQRPRPSRLSGAPEGASEPVPVPRPTGPPGSPGHGPPHGTPGHGRSTASQADPGTGPIGRDRDPILAVLLVFLTLGIYRLYWLWVTSDEVDRYDPEAPPAHDMVQLGILVMAVALGVGLLLIVWFVYAVSGGRVLTGGPGPAVGLVGLGLLLLFAGGLLLLVGEYRIWTKIQDAEEYAGHHDPISPILLLVLVLVPFINFVGGPLAVFIAQDRLNDVWRRARNARAAGTERAW